MSNTSFTLERAEQILLQKQYSKSTFERYSADVLRTLCHKYSVAVVSTGRRQKALKKDYINALWTYVSECILRRIGSSHRPAKCTRDRGGQCCCTSASDRGAVARSSRTQTKIARGARPGAKCKTGASRSAHDAAVQDSQKTCHLRRARAITKSQTCSPTTI